MPTGCDRDRGHRCVGQVEHAPGMSLMHGHCAVCLEPWPCRVERAEHPLAYADKLVEPSPVLVQLSHRLEHQDNRATGHPIYLVQQRRRVYGLEEGHAHGFDWRDKDSDEFTIYEGHRYFGHDDGIQEAIRDKIAEELDLQGVLGRDIDHEDRDPEKHGFEKLYYFEYYDYVTAHFTEAAAERYIRENAHKLTKPRVYVESQYRCHEWIEAVEHLKGVGR